MRGRAIGWMAVLAGSLACTTQEDPQQRAGTGGTLVTTAGGVSIEVLDWGGSGPALVFLAGGGPSTPHVYDDFAPMLTDSFRVIGITRRGNGGSSAVPPSGFDDYVDDIVAVLDAKQLDSVVLVGHSFAGLEMARFGEKYGGRCAGLIYLDAAYDYTDPGLVKIFEAHQPPMAPPMLASDSASVEAVRAWTARTQGITLPASAVRAERSFGPDGRLTNSVQRRGAEWHVEIPTPRWEAVECRSLGVYAMPEPYETSLRYWNELEATQRESANAYLAAFTPWTASNRTKFGSLPQNQVVEFPSSNHYFFLEKPDEAARVIRRFASEIYRSR